MKKQPAQMPADWCLFCELGGKPVEGQHAVPVNDHHNHTQRDFMVRCKRSMK